ncbi:hypothetical protein EGI11_06735 [Chryseobacterium sp. H3056]|uniref:PKD domain-containing protein n=1 Tax=Kaistella daneshvariae TaxID=2487074 RepID=A0A3N0WVL6_9FLAO|nr:hypothetical protein [Kaistella daneshvariae]ROI09102.1 hypothetical protein EGI11_06735 [Kaistella daneshvariae]
MKFKFLLILFLAMAGFVSAQTITPPTPQIGDFRSKATGNWTDPAIWQIYNGSIWEDTITEYPGKGTTSITPATYSASISPSTIVSVAGNQVYYFGNLYVLADQIPSTSGGTATYGRLYLSSLSSLSLLGNNQDLIVLGGIVRFSPNSTLKLKKGATIELKYKDSPNCLGGINLLQPVNSDTNILQKIVFVDGASENVYATSYSSSPEYKFSELNCGGGSLNAALSASTNPVCANRSITLSSAFNGFISTADALVPKTYVWTSVNGSTTTTYTDTTANLNVTLTTPGTHVFKVEVSYLSTMGFQVSADQIINVEVLAAGDPLCVGCFKDPALDTTKHPSVHGITSLKRAGDVNGDNWPMVRESAYTVLESNSKGFVINRLTTTQLNAIATAGNAVDGMMAYDTTEKCLKLYVVDLVNPANTGWSCFTTPACPN